MPPLLGVVMTLFKILLEDTSPNKTYPFFCKENFAKGIDKYTWQNYNKNTKYTCQKYPALWKEG